MREVYKLPVLPFEPTEVEGAMSERTLDFHYHKHHQAYVDKTNELLADAKPGMKDLSIENLIRKAEGPLFNNASQIWNHTFLWLSLAKPSATELSMRKILSESFGQIKTCRKEFIEAGMNHFGSGWLWLIQDQSSQQLSWVALHDAESPLMEGCLPLLTCDLWEHAYYLDHQNDRATYLHHFFDHLNWKFAEEVLNGGAPPVLDPLVRPHAQLSDHELRQASGAAF